MYIIKITIFIHLLLVVFSFPFIKIEPQQQFHDKRKSLIVICNSTSYNKRTRLLYEYNGSNFTIPRTNDSNPYLYYGNLTVTNPKQFKVNVMCLEKDSFDLIGAKIYLFGYPPEVVLTGGSTPKLTCQDFNLRRVLCCMSPSENEIARLTGLVEEQNGHLKIELINTQSEVKESKFNNSCFNVSSSIYTPSLTFNILVSNDLGRQKYNFEFNRSTILKPEAPKLFLSEEDKILSLSIELVDDGEFEINVTCSSNSPKNIIKKLSKSVTKRAFTIKFDGWLPYSIVSCTIQSKIIFGTTTMGQFSEVAMSRHRMLEAEPNSGPISSPALMTYESLSDDGFLENIILYFLDLRLIDQNGVITKYIWNCGNCFQQNGLKLNGNETEEKNIRNIKISKAKVNSLIFITACTLAGCSRNWSKIYLEKQSEVDVKVRIYLFHNDSNWHLLWYLNNQSFVETSPNFGVQNSEEAQPSVLLCYKMKYETANPENTCSSTELIQLNQSFGKTYLSMNDRIPMQFAYIKSFNNLPFSKLAWHTCLYERSMDSEIALSKVKFEKYVSHETNCTFSKCNVFLKIKIPPCSKLNTVIFEGVKIEYSFNTGQRNVSQYFSFNNEMRISLFDLNSDDYYDFKILVITPDDIVFWGTHKIYTGWFAVYKIILIILGIIAIIFGFGVFIKKIYTQQKNVVFKKNYANTSHKTTKHSSIKPLTLNNTSNIPQFSNIDNVLTNGVSNSSFRAIIQQNTDMTLIESSTDTTNSSCTYTNTSEDINESQPNSDNSYIIRPEQNKNPPSKLLRHNFSNNGTESHMRMVDVESKINNERITNDMFESNLNV